jgi:DnaD/phage-associated family protein
MARGRMIASTVATDKRFNSLSSDAALIYLMTIPHLDRDGLILGDAMPLWGRVCPRRTEFIPFMDELIAEWAKSGLVIAYACEDGRVLYFVGFGKNQTGMRYDRESPSIFPPPPNYIRTSNGLEKHSDGAMPEEVRHDAGVVPDEIPLKAKQSKLKETGGGSWQDVVDTYEHEIGTFTETISEEMKAYYDDVGAILMIDAIKESARANIRKWSYVDGILKKWRVNGRQSPRQESGADAWQQLNGDIPDYMRT